MTLGLIVAAFAAVVTVVGVIFIVVRHRRKVRTMIQPQANAEELEKAVAAIRARATSIEKTKKRGGKSELMQLQHGDLSVTLHYDPPAPKRNTVVRFGTSIERMFVTSHETEDPYRGSGQKPVALLDHRPEIFFRKEGRLDGLGKGLAINSELQTGDATFDDAVYVRSETDRPVIEALLARREMRTAIQGMTDAGFHIYLNGPQGNMTAARVNPSPEDLAAEALDTLLQNMATVVAGLPPVESTSPNPRPNRGRSLVAAAYALGFFGLGAFVVKVMLDDWPWQVIRLGALLGQGALPGLGIWVVFLVALLLRVRGRSHGMSYLLQGGVAMLIGLTGTGAVTAYVLNGALDTSEETVRNVRVVRRSIVGNESKSYHLHMKSWIPGVDEVQVEVSWHVYRSFKNPHSKRWIPGEITTRAGYLGYSWMTGMHRVERGP